jgi:GNAT superfamily N-acetyltransferase
MEAAAITIAEEPAASQDVRWCFGQYYAELERRLPEGFDVTAAVPLGLEDVTPPRGLVLVARWQGRPVGCGALKLTHPSVAEIKRLWVAAEVRGQGLGNRVLATLEQRAVEAGRRLAHLDTNGTLIEAMALYRRRGYVEIAPFNRERFADHWLGKDLLASSPSPITGGGETKALAADREGPVMEVEH